MPSSGAIISDIDKGWRYIKQALENLQQADSYVKVGFLGEKAAAAHTDPDAQGGGSQMTNVELGIIHEFGAGNIPARSFIRSTFDAHKQDYVATLRRLIPALYTGRASVFKVLDIVGMQMKTDMKNAILRGPGLSPPLAPSTVKAKGSSRPLVDTGRLVQAIDHAVVIRNRLQTAPEPQGVQIGSATVVGGAASPEPSKA